MIDRSDRPNLHTVTERDPPFLFHRGEGYERHRLPAGATVMCPNRPLPPVPDRRAAIHQARDIAGRDASIMYFHCPPVMMCALPV